MKESEIEKYFAQECAKRGMKAVKMLPTYEAGIPDRGIMYNGTFGFAEIKTRGKEPRKLQTKYMQEIKKAGFFAEVVDSKEAAIEWIERFKAFSKVCKCGNR